MILALAVAAAAPLQVTPAAVEGREHLVYELALPAPASDLRSLEVQSADGAVLARYDASAIASRTDAASGRLYVEIDTAAAPAVLLHRFTNTAGKVTLVPVAIGTKRRTALGPPLGAGTWVAVHAPDWPRGHRRVYYTVDGVARLPGRFAIDFVGVDANGRVTRGDPNRPADAIGYGAPVLAVADATVVAARYGMKESASIAGNGGHPDHAAAGNYVALRLRDGRFAFYEHLAPGSITVRPGQRARRGQTIGRLGFTGSSTGPHLHFHVADGPTPLGSEGLPFAFDRFRLVGRYADIGRLGQTRWESAGDIGERRKREWPGYNVVVRFD